MANNNSEEKIIGSFNYLVVMLALRFVDNNFEMEGKSESKKLPFKEKIECFNQFNDFGFSKVSLFPFLLTIANGKKNDLLNHFTLYETYYFKPNELGIINVGFNNVLLLNSNLLHFSTSRFSTKINLNLFNTITTEAEYKKSIPTQLLNEFEIETILDKIDYSINFLHKNRIPYFANKVLNSLSELSKDNLAYRTYFNEIQNSTFKEEEILGFKKIVNAETYNLGATTAV